jgi:hypothetical protein
MLSMAAKARTARYLERDIGGSMLRGASQGIGASACRNARFLALNASFLSRMWVSYRRSLSLRRAFRDISRMVPPRVR